MAIIYSYPLNQPKRDDLLIGTITYDEDAVNPVHGNPTVSFTIGSLLDLVSGQGNAQNLQQVTNIGNTTTNSIVISNNLLVSGGYYDSSNQPGTAGQLLSSTATGTQWVNVSAQGVTSVGLSMPAAFTVTNSPITQAGILAVTGAGTAAQYINGLGNLVTFPTIPTQYVLPVATTVALGGIKIGYTEAGKNYPLELDNERAYVNVPWTDTPYTLPVATSTDLGGVKIGYTDNAKNYAVELDSDQMYVNVPWTDTPYVLPLAADGTRGGVQIGYTQTATRDYPVTLDNEKMLVTVPWTDTPPNPFQTITGTGTANASTGIILSDNGGTVLLNGTGSVTVTRDAATSGTIVINGTDTGITTVVVKASTISTGFGISEIINARELELYPHYYAGTTNVGFVPTGGSATTFLRGDGSWGAIPTGLQFQGTWDARNIAEGGASDGGDPNLDGIAGAADGWLYIVSVAGSAVPNGAATTPNSWNIGDWCVFDGTNWTRVPASTTGVTTFTSNFTSTGVGDPQYISGSTLTADTGGVDIGRVNLNATGTQDSTTFLRGDNTWDVPAYIPNTDTQNIYTNSWQQSTDDIILRKVLSGAGSGTQDIKIVKGANITFTYTDDDNFTIAASDTQENTTWYIRDSADADKTVNDLKYLKFVTATGTLGTALTGAGSTADPYLMTLTSPDTNTQNTYTAGTGLGLSSFEFSANVDATEQTVQPETVTAEADRTYAVQVDDTNDNLVVNVPWLSGGTYDWEIKDNQGTPSAGDVASGKTVQFVAATGALSTVLTDPNSDGNFVMTLTSPDEDTLYDLAGAADISVAANYNLVLSADGSAQDTMVFKKGSNITFTRAANSLTIAAVNDNDQYALAGAASATAGEYDLVLSNDGTDQDTMVFKQGSNITFTRAADLLTITATNTWNANTKTVPGYVAAPGAVASKVWKTDASGNPAWRDDATGDNNTYTLTSTGKVITLNDTTGTSTPAGTITFVDGNDITVSSAADNTITIASTFTEADTLATVTGRGATTTTKSYFNGDLEVNNTITVTRTGSNNGKISIEGNPPLLELKNYDGQTASDQLLSSIEFYGSDTSSSNVAGVRASINCNTGFDDPTGTSNRNQGCLEFATYNGTDVSNSPLQRLKITPDGGFSFGNTSTAYGTSGQVLTSAGDAPPTWETPGDENDFLTGLAFDTSDGVLTATVSNQSDVTVDLDGRYLTEIPVATTTILGGIELGSATVLNTAYVTGNTGSTTRSYPVQLNTARQAAVYVPWVNTWVANSSTAAGYVASGANQANKVWKTNASGVPAWRADADGGVTKFTNEDGTFISAGTVNTEATGAVTVGTIDLSATGLSGTPATAATQFLSGANTWSVPPDTWIANAVTVAGYVAAPAATDANLVWKTNASGEPAWRADSDGGVSKITASTNITISPAGGTGNVTISATDTNTTYSAGDGINFSGTPATQINADINYISYNGNNNFIDSASNLLGSVIPTQGRLLYRDTSNQKIVSMGYVDDLPFSNNSGTVTGTGTSGVVAKWNTAGTGLIDSGLSFPPSTTYANFVLGASGGTTVQFVGNASQTGDFSIKNTTGAIILQPNNVAIASRVASFSTTDIRLNESTIVSGTYLQTVDNTATPLGNLYVGSKITTGDTLNGFRINSVSGGLYFDVRNTGDQIIYRDYDGASVNDRFKMDMSAGTFTASGDLIAYGSPSDKRLKENIKPIESALDKAMKLQGVTFDWKQNDNILSIKQDIGFIAQDVQEVIPELVRENEDGMLSMRHQGIAPILLEAIKELKAEIEELKCKSCNCK